MGEFSALLAMNSINPINSLDNKGSCWILKDFYCSVTMLWELGLKTNSTIYGFLNCIETESVNSISAHFSKKTFQQVE